MRPSRCLATTALARGGGVPQTPSAAYRGPAFRMTARQEPQRSGHFCPPPSPATAESRGPARIPETASPPALLPLPPLLVKQLVVGFLSPVTFITPVRPI